MEHEDPPAYSETAVAATPPRPTGYRSLLVLLVFMAVLLAFNIAASVLILEGMDLSNAYIWTTPNPWSPSCIWISGVTLLYSLCAMHSVRSAQLAHDKPGLPLGWMSCLGLLVWCIQFLAMVFALIEVARAPAFLHQTPHKHCLYVPHGQSPITTCSSECSECCCCLVRETNPTYYERITFFGVSSCQVVFEKLIPLMYFSTGLFCLTGVLMSVTVYWSFVMRLSCTSWSNVCGPFPPRQLTPPGNQDRTWSVSQPIFTGQRNTSVGDGFASTFSGPSERTHLIPSAPYAHDVDLPGYGQLPSYEAGNGNRGTCAAPGTSS